jgi:hypothetical protein
MIRFLADADLDEGIVIGCRRRETTMDFLAANDAGLKGVPDPEVLRIAKPSRSVFSFLTISKPCHATSGSFSRRAAIVLACSW